MRSLAAFAMRGRFQAVSVVLGLAALSVAIPLVSILSAAALGLVALRLGSRESAWVLGISLLGLSVLSTALAGSPLPLLVYGLLIWLPMWVAAVALRESGQLALTLEFMTGVALLAVGAVYGVVDDPAQRGYEVMHRVLQPMLEHAPQGFDTTRIEEGIAFFSHYFSGLTAAGALLSLIVGLLLARGQQAVLFNPGGFRKEFMGLRLHRPVVYLGLVLIAVTGLSTDRLAEVAGNLLIPFSVLCVIAGFSVLHGMMAGVNKFWLIGMYVLLLIIPQAILPIALLGLSDVWADWRRRFGQRN